MKAAVAIDNWKLPIFEKHLSEAGFTYTQGKGLTKDTLHLYVETSDMMHMEVLEGVIRAANDAAALRRRQ